MDEDASADLELLNQGKQTKPVLVQERFGPQETPFHPQGGNHSSKGVMEVRNGGDIPGVTGPGACKETALVVDEMGDDHFDNLVGKPGGRR